MKGWELYLGKSYKQVSLTSTCIKCMNDCSEAA